MLRAVLILIAVILLLVTAYVYYTVFWGGERLRSPEELAQTVLGNGSDEEKTRAALALADWAKFDRPPAKREAAREQMRRVFRESRNPDVRAAMVQALGELRDLDSVPELLKIVKNPAESERMRGAAAVAIGDILQYRFRDYQANDPDRARQQRAIQQMEKEYEAHKKRPPESG
jgi:hypothetical protein